MRLLLTADWHLSANPRDAYRFAAVEQIHKIVREQAVEQLFILGDLTDFPDHHSAAFTNRVVETLASFTPYCDVTILRGTPSHDGTDPAVPFYRFINAVDGLTYITEIDYWQHDGYRVMLIPCGLWPETLPDNIDAVFTHETFAGARAENDGRLGGMRLPFTRIPIYSGDVHVPQRHGPVTYIGAPTLIRFGDTYKPRVILIDTALDGPVGKRMYATIPVTGVPSKRLVEVKAGLDGFTWDVRHVNRDDIVKVRVSFPNPHAIPSLAHLSADIHAAAKVHGFSIHAVESRVATPDTRTPSVPVARSDRDLVIQYGKAHQFEREVIEAGLSIVAKP